MTLVDAALVRGATRTSVNLLRLVRVGILLMSLLEGLMRPRTIPLLRGASILFLLCHRWLARLVSGLTWSLLLLRLGTSLRQRATTIPRCATLKAAFCTAPSRQLVHQISLLLRGRT